MSGRDIARATGAARAWSAPELADRPPYQDVGEQLAAEGAPGLIRPERSQPEASCFDQGPIQGSNLNESEGNSEHLKPHRNASSDPRPSPIGERGYPLRCSSSDRTPPERA
jgi:hypothetical protein